MRKKPGRADFEWRNGFREHVSAQKSERYADFPYIPLPSMRKKPGRADFEWGVPLRQRHTLDNQQLLPREDRILLKAVDLPQVIHRGMIFLGDFPQAVAFLYRIDDHGCSSSVDGFSLC